MKGFKGYAPGLVCLWKKYEENTIAEEESAVICHRGLHFCENPMDVLDHYPILNDKGEFNEFTDVEALDEVKTDDNKKYCTTKLKIGTKLTIPGFIKACVDFMVEKTVVTNETAASGDAAKLAASGYAAQLAASGNYAQLAASGEDSVVAGIGIDNTAKAAKGCWITLAEWTWDKEKGRYIPVCVKTEFVDGERIKADVVYKLENGEFKEVNNA